MDRGRRKAASTRVNVKKHAANQSGSEELKTASSTMAQSVDHNESSEDNSESSEEHIQSIINQRIETIGQDSEANSQTELREELTKRKDVYYCRICHDKGKKEWFIAPCLCKGSLNLVHKRCLETWLAASDSTHCELCGFTYRTKRSPKYMVLSSIFAWLLCATNGQERRLLLWDIITLMVLLPLMALCSILGIKVANNVLLPESHNKVGEAVMTRVLQMILLGGVLLLDLGVISWTAIRIQFHYQMWYTWYRKNCKVVLLDYLDQIDFPFEFLTPSSSSSVRIIQF